MADAKEIFYDAQALHSQALKEMEEGNLRQAAEKAWCATLRATQALVLGRLGEESVRSDVTTRRLHSLALQDCEVEEKLVGRYHTRLSVLHGDCFYMGICEPEEDIKRRIIETRAYIEDARALADGKRQKEVV